MQSFLGRTVSGPLPAVATSLMTFGAEGDSTKKYVIGSRNR